MKIILCRLVIALVSYGVVYGLYNPRDSQYEISPRGLIEDTINNTLNNLLANLSDPISVDGFALNFTTDVLSGNASLTDLKISGLKSLFASHITSDGLFDIKLNVTVKVPEILFTSKYTADALLADLVPLYGDGRISAILDDIQLDIKASADVLSFNVTDINLGIYVGDATFDLHGLIDNEEFSSLVSNMLNDNIIAFIDNNQEVITNLINPIIEDVIQLVLKKNSTLTVEDFDLHFPKQFNFV